MELAGRRFTAKRRFMDVGEGGGVEDAEDMEADD